MKFPNAYDGVKKLYLAEVLLLVGAVLSLVSAIFYKNDTMMTIAAVVALISTGFSIVAYFMCFGLLKKAKKMLAA